MEHISPIFESGLEHFNFSPEYPDVVFDDEGVAFLQIKEGREYEIKRNIASVLQLLNHLAQKSWADNDFFDLATLRICMAMGWWYRDHYIEQDRHGFYLSRNLILKRGWNRKMIDEFLGEPEDIFYGFGVSYKVTHKYEYERVVRVESTKEWQKNFTETLPRRVASSDKTLSDLIQLWGTEQANQKRRHDRYMKRKAEQRIQEKAD